MRQALRTTVESSAIKECQLCAGVPSCKVRLRGYRVTPQVKAGSFRIDMVVEGGDDARLALECDGDDFHGPDRWQADMSRQRVLERAGWMFWRCFASTWSLRKDDVLQELLARLHAMGIEPLGAMERTPSLVDYREWGDSGYVPRVEPLPLI